MKVAICDDNKMYLKSLSTALHNEFKQRSIRAEIYEYTSGDIFIKHHMLDPFDAVFLDIDMPENSGFYIAKEIAASENSCQIIFVTAHSELVYDSFLFRPLNFISKIDEKGFHARLETVINQLLEHLKQETIIVLKSSNGTQTITALKDVLYIDSRGHIALYHILDEEEPVPVRSNISELEKRYADCNFARSHKKYLINLKHVLKTDPGNNKVIFKQHFDLPMGRNYKISFEESLTSYLRRIK